MINAVNNIAPIRAPELTQVAPRGSAPASGFGDAFQSALNTVNTAQHDAASSVERFLNGEGEELHQVALAQQTAALTFDLFLQVRSKVVQAYQEVMRLQV
jgi:flagellar hook-basal body complex protein FliE